MAGTCKAIKVSEHVYWVGAIDWGLRDFHGYATERGSTYNAYLITADKPTLIDTVKAPFMDEMMSRIASVIPPGNIDYIISNHSEMDHSGCLPRVIEAVKPEKVFASVMGVRALSDHFHTDHEILAVKDGESLSLGNLNVSFTETRMVHWPDSMFTYLAEDDLLFSQDGFGMHLATSKIFADENDQGVLDYELAKYYANILMPLSPIIAKLLEKVTGLGIKPKIIAPDHGPIWRRAEDIEKVIGLYAKWAEQKPTRKAVVVYDTMWQSTAAMARAIGDGLRAGGVRAQLMPMSGTPRSNVATEILGAGAFLVGSPTINNNMFPTIADVLTYLKGLRPRNLIGAAFGSYGWAGGAVKDVEQVLKDMKVDLVAEGLAVKFVPTEDDLAKCFDLGSLVAEKLNEVCDRE